MSHVTSVVVLATDDLPLAPLERSDERDGWRGRLVPITGDDAIGRSWIVNGKIPYVNAWVAALNGADVPSVLRDIAGMAWSDDDEVLVVTHDDIAGSMTVWHLADGAFRHVFATT